MKDAPRRALWDVFAFLLLLSSGLVMVFVLLATNLYYPTFDLRGQLLAWLVVLGGIAVLVSLGQSMLRLYIRPALREGRQRRTERRARRRNA